MDFGAFLTTYFVIILIVNGLLAFIPAYIAREKGRSFVAFWWLSFATTVVIGLIAVLAMPQLSADQMAQRDIEPRFDGVPRELQCPFCAEFVKSEAKICKYCGKDVEEQFARKIEIHRAEKNQQLAQRAQAEKLKRKAQRELESQRSKRRSEYRAWAKSPGGITVFATLSLILVGSVTLSVLTSQAQQQAAAEKQAAELEKQNASDRRTLEVIAGFESLVSVCNSGNEIEDETVSSMGYRKLLIDKVIVARAVSDLSIDLTVGSGGCEMEQLISLGLVPPGFLDSFVQEFFVFPDSQTADYSLDVSRMARFGELEFSFEGFDYRGNPFELRPEWDAIVITNFVVEVAG